MSSEIFRETDPFATHQLFLKHYIEQTSGDIIEFGTGHGSTPLILDLIKGTDRNLVSVESDQTWFEQMQEMYPPNHQHTYHFVSNWEADIVTLANELSNNISVCFIDSSPWHSRTLAMTHFKDRSDYVMIHDVDYFPTNGIFGKQLGPCTFDFSDVGGDRKNWQVYFPYQPWPAPTGPPTLVFTTKNKPIKPTIM